jgi:hypothetical protein
MLILLGYEWNPAELAGRKNRIFLTGQLISGFMLPPSSGTWLIQMHVWYTHVSGISRGQFSTFFPGNCVRSAMWLTRVSGLNIYTISAMNTTADLLNSVDNRLKQYKPSTVILATLAVLGGVQILNSIRRTGVKKSVRQLLGVLLRAVRHVPGVSGVVSKQQEKMADDITKLFTKHDQEPGMPARISALPEKGISQADIFGMIDVLSKREQEIVKEGKFNIN